jgi:hypothetical protein
MGARGEAGKAAFRVRAVPAPPTIDTLTAALKQRQE